MLSSSIRLVTSRMVMSARVMVISSGRSSRRRDRVTCVPDSPRTCLTASSSDRPLTLSPSMAVTMSPALSPAFSAGESSSGATTTRAQVSLKLVHASRSSGLSRLRTPISAPMPLNWPDRSPRARW